MIATYIFFDMIQDIVLDRNFLDNFDIEHYLGYLK